MASVQLSELSLGERLKRLRREWSRRHGVRMTQEVLAKMVGVSRGTIAAWESDKQRPDSDNLARLAQVFETTVEELRGGGPYWVADVPAATVREPTAAYQLSEGLRILLTDRVALYQALSNYGPPGENRDDKEALIELLYKVAARLRREGRHIPLDLVNEAHANLLNGEV